MGTIYLGGIAVWTFIGSIVCRSCVENGTLLVISKNSEHATCNAEMLSWRNTETRAAAAIPMSDKIQLQSVKVDPDDHKPLHINIHVCSSRTSAQQDARNINNPLNPLDLNDFLAFLLSYDSNVAAIPVFHGNHNGATWWKMNFIQHRGSSL